MQDYIFEECYKRYLDAKPGELFWGELAEKFGYDSNEKLRKHVQREREARGLPPKGEVYVNEDGGLDPKNYIDKFEQNISEDSGESSITMNFPEDEADLLKDIFEKQNKTEEDLLRFHGFDVDSWVISHGKSNGWNMPSGEGRKIICFQSKITVIPKGSRGLTLEDIDDFFSTYEFEEITMHKPTTPSNHRANGDVLEIDFADFHFGNQGSYGVDLSVEEKVESVIQDIYARCEHRSFSKILLVLLGDTIHFDTKARSTSAGTLVTTDGRSHEEVFDSAEDSIIKATNAFAQIAPVEVISVNGNHDYTTSYMFMKTLEAYFRNDDNIQVDTGRSSRKFRLIGNTLLGFAHGNMSIKNMSGWLQVEAREEWGLARWSEIHAGHVHHQKGSEFGGIITRYLPSITDTDEWHYDKGFIGSRKGAMSFVWSLEKGFREMWFSSVD